MYLEYNVSLWFADCINF